MPPSRGRSRSWIAAALGLLLHACAAPRPAPAPGTLRIYLARHGQTDWNAEKRLQGHTDIDLNARGREQAAGLARRLAGVQFDRVYSSTLKRSRETAEAARGTVPLEPLDGLRERNMGKFQGLRLDASEPERQAEYERRIRDPDDALDGGETANQHFERVRTTIDSILARHPSGAILIVGHAGTNRLILRALLGLTPAEADKVDQANDELYLIEVTAGRKPLLWKNVGESNLADL